MKFRPGSGRKKLAFDDSAYSRQTITRMLAASPLVEVVGRWVSPFAGELAPRHQRHTDDMARMEPTEA